MSKLKHSAVVPMNSFQTDNNNTEYRQLFELSKNGYDSDESSELSIHDYSNNVQQSHERKLIFNPTSIYSMQRSLLKDDVIQQSHDEVNIVKLYCYCCCC